MPIEEWNVESSDYVHLECLDIFSHCWKFDFDECSLGIMNCGYMEDYELGGEENEKVYHIKLLM